MSTYIERLAVKNGDAIDTYKVVTDGQSFTRTCVGKNYYKITDTALANGCLIDLLVNNPSDGIDIYIYQNSTWYHFLNKSSVYGSNRTAYAKHICFNCGNGGRIFMHGETDSTDCEINSTRGITATKILFALSYGTIAVRRTCLDSTAVLYNSFEEVLEEVDVLSLISDINSVPYYNNDATNGYIIHSFVDKSTFDSTLSDYLHYSTVTSAYNSVSTTSADVLSTSTFLGKCSASDTACTLFTAKQIKTYVKNDDDATLKFTKCGNVAAYMEDLPGRGTTTVDIPIQQCGDYFGNEYTTVYSLTSEEMSNTAYFTRWKLGTVGSELFDTTNTVNHDCILINGCFGNWTTGRVYISAALSTRGGYKLTGTYSINGRYALSNIALTIYGSNLYLYLKGEYQFAHFTLTAASDSFTPQTSEVTTVTSSVGGTDVFSQLYPSAFSVNIGAVSSTYVTSVYTYTPDAMNGCMVYYYALEASQEGELQMITKNSNGSAVLAIASGETGYWGAQTLCLTGYIPPGGTAVLYGKKLASSFMWALPC